MRHIFFLLIIAPFFFSCSIKRDISSSLSENKDPLLLSVLWFQKSAEMQALYYQGYKLLIGDNLADFDEVFDKREDDLGFGAVTPVHSLPCFLEVC